MTKIPYLIEIEISSSFWVKKLINLSKPRFDIFVKEWGKKLDINVRIWGSKYFLTCTNEQNMALILELIESKVDFYKGEIDC